MPEYDLADILVHMNQTGRGVPALDTILSILHDNLPQVLAHFEFPAIQTWDYAGVELDAAKIPAILVGSSIRTEQLGTHYGDDAHVLVTCAYMPQITRRQVQDSLDIVQCVRAVLSMPGVVGPRYDGDRVLWNWLLPAGFSMVPPDWPMYSGWIAEFTMRQSPQSNLWES